MKRNLERDFPSTAKKIVIRNDHHEEDHHCCILDVSISSELLLSKISDIPHKLKYEIIMKPVLEYCFGKSDKNSNPRYYMDQLMDFKIDWIRDERFIYDQILNLPINNFMELPRELTIWNNRSFALQCIQCYYTVDADVNIMQYINNNLFKDREIIKAAVKENGFQLRCASEELVNDFEIVKLAVQQYGKALQYASNELQHNREIVKLAVEQDGHALRFAANEFQNDKEIMRIALESCIRCARDAFEYDIDIKIAQVRKLFKNDREYIMSAAKINGDIGLKYASNELRNDREIVMQAIHESPKAFQYVSDELKSDRELVKMVVMKNGQYLKYIPKEFQEDAEIVELALKSSPDSVSQISERFKSDIEFMTRVLGIRGFYTIPDQFIHDREIILESIKINPKNLLITNFLDYLFNDREFVLQAVTLNGKALEHVLNHEFKQDREIVLAAVTQNGIAIQYAPNAFFDDEEIVLKSVETLGNSPFWYFSKISQRLTRNSEFLTKLAKRNSAFFNYLPIEFTENREIVMEHLKGHPLIVFDSTSAKLKTSDRVLAIRAVKLDGLILEKMCFQYRNDRLIVSYAIQQNKKALRFASYELRHDKEILELCK